jgi:CBS domain containing-hemolysin-like protein
MLADHFISLLSMTILLLLSAFFSGTETALFSLTREQVKRLRERGRHEEGILSLLADNPSGLLITILFGNIVVNILFFSLSVVVTSDVAIHLGDWGEAIVGVGVLLLVILVGEILPKAIGISFPEPVVRLNALPLRSWFHFLGPVRRMLESITKLLEPKESAENPLSAEELKLLIEATQHDPTFGKQEKAIVEDIVNLPEIRVRELMVPRVRQLFRHTDSPVGEALRAAAEQELELIPVYDGEEDNVVGVVEVCELFSTLDTSRPLGNFIHPVQFVPETKRADEMLREFLAERMRMVCVVDEFGGLAGTIVLEDLLEEVVGEFDAMEAPPIERLGECTYRLQGSLGIREWRSLFVGFLPDEVVRTLALDTLSGLVVSLLKRMPKPGDVAQVHNLRFTVEQVRSNRIESILLELVGGCS